MIFGWGFCSGPVERSHAELNISVLSLEALGVGLRPWVGEWGSLLRTNEVVGKGAGKSLVRNSLGLPPTGKDLD